MWVILTNKLLYSEYFVAEHNIKEENAQSYGPLVGWEEVESFQSIHATGYIDFPSYIRF